MAAKGQRHWRRRLKTNPELCAREREVCILVAEGETNAMIGQRMGISRETAKAHIYNACQKAGCDNRVQLAMWWSRRTASEQLQALRDENVKLRRQIDHWKTWFPN